MEFLTSIGIIGGADGPTQIIVSGEPGIESILVTAVLVTAIAFAAIWHRRKNK